MSTAPPSYSEATSTAHSGSPTRSRRGFSAYVVFHGRTPGVYLSWSLTKLQTDKFRGAVDKGYCTVEAAKRAFNLATDQGFIRNDPEQYSTPLPPAYETPSTAEEALARARQLDPERREDEVWYVVVQGRRTGIFATYIESMMMTNGVKDSSCERFEDRIKAQLRWDEVQRLGHAVRLV